MGLGTESVALVSVRTETFIPSLESSVPKLIKRGLGRAPSSGLKRTLKRLARGLKVSKLLNLLQFFFFPESWLLAMIASGLVEGPSLTGVGH